MSDEHTVSLQSSMQFLPTRRPVVVLHRVEEQFPEWIEIMLSAVCLCVCMQTKGLCHLIPIICMAERKKCFLGIVCYLSFCVVSDFKDDFSHL